MSDNLMEPQDVYFPASPTGCLAVLWPALTAFHTTTRAGQRLNEKAQMLARIPRIALELRLNQSTDPPDLHQMAQLQQEDRSALQDWASASPHTIYPEGLVRFLNDLDDDAPEHVYFEWDHSHLDNMPAIFLPIDHQSDMGDRAALRAKRLHMLTTLAGRADGIALPSWLEAVRISHIGLMSSRGDLVRVNLRGVLPEELPGLLQQANWPGDMPAACRLFEELVEIGDKVTVALNVLNGNVTGYLGCEILLKEVPRVEPRWQAAFDILRKRFVCTEDEAACLQALPRTLFPYERDARWPACWMVATELRGGTAVPSATLGLSHLKVSLADDGVCTAKAYVSAQHEWNDREMVRPALDSKRSSTETINAAIHYLLQQRQQNGWWRDFSTAQGPSNEWVSAFVACALAMSSRHDAQAAAKDVLERLVSQQRVNGGWGYNALTASDADSTVWVLRLMDALGYTGDSRDQALVFLKHHVTENGVRTYDKQTPMLFGSQTPLADPSGWQNAHDCVTANALPFLDACFRQTFASRQQDDGSWAAYWWWTPALATALAAETLAADESHAEAVARAVDWARTYIPATASCFVDAFKLRLLLLGETTEADATRVAADLRALQREDGGWAADSDLRIPHAHETRGASATANPLERTGVFTTAAVVMALLQSSLRPERQS